MTTTPSPPTLIAELEAVDGELADLRRQLAMVEVQELEARLNAYTQLDYASTQRDRDTLAAQSSLSFKKEAMVVRGEIQALEDRRDYLHHAICYG